MKALWTNLFLLILWLAIVIWLVGCGCGHTAPAYTADDIGHALYNAHYSAINDRFGCRIVDRIESSVAGVEDDWIVFEDNDSIPRDRFPDAREGSSICVNPPPADVADLQAPAWFWECLADGQSPTFCAGQDGGAL